MGKYIIYTLSEGVDNPSELYIGRTKLPLEIRLMAHKCESQKDKSNKDRVIKKWANSESGIVISELDTTDDYENSYDLETFWIHQLSSWGFKVVNSYKVIKKLWSPKNISKNKFSRKQLLLIRKKYNRGDADIIATNLGISNEMVRICLKGEYKIVKQALYEYVLNFYKINQAA